MKIAICDFELRTLELIKNFVADTDTLGDQPFKILSYENPFDMLAYYSRYRDIDIILLNVEMKSGYDVAKELRKLDKKVEIIFLGKTTEYSNAIVHAFQKFRAPFSGKIVHIFPEQSAVI